MNEEPKIGQAFEDHAEMMWFIHYICSFGEEYTSMKEG